ncbi:MAG: ATP-binding protein [Candidatus Altiarchaeota archaeon]
MDISRLELFNEWWTTGSVRKELTKEYRRPLFDEVLKYLNDRQIILIYGLRRVGKSTLMYQIIQHLLKQGIGADRIFRFSFDDTEAQLDEVLRVFEREKLRKNFEQADRVYVFFDEIQKTADWQNKLKIFYDLYPNIKFFICGSASISIQKKAKESLAGRTYDFHMKPLTFAEFLKLKGIDAKFDHWKTYKRTVAPSFYDHLRKGGFPELTDETDEEKIRSYVKNNVIDRILYVDLPAEFGLKDPQLLKTIVELTADHPGMIVNYDALKNDLKRNKQTIMSYFTYLEYALILKLVANIRPGFLSTSRKMRKAYHTSTAFPLSIARNPDDTLMGRVVENLMVQELDAEYYFRDKGFEIDFIIKKGGKTIPIEIKYGKPDASKFAKALARIQLDNGIIVTKDQDQETEVDGRKIKMIPAWAFILFKEKFI